MVLISEFNRIKNAVGNLRTAELIFAAWFATYRDEKDFIFRTQPEWSFVRKLFALGTLRRARRSCPTTFV
jgi:hypothetical protein